MITYYIVATSYTEARAILNTVEFTDIHHTDRKSAEEHLAEVKTPPTDNYYANQYRIFQVTIS